MSLSLFGIILGLVLLMFLAYKGYSIIWVAPVCAVVVAVLSGYAILGPCDYMDVMAPDWKSAQMNIVMKDKEVNVLQLIVRGLENL